MRLDHKIAVITGGSRGIGFATEDSFLTEGAAVVITASTPETAQKAVKKLKALHPAGRITRIAPNLASMDSVKEASYITGVVLSVDGMARS